ncbi:MAG: acyl-protein synthetase [Oscillospiraceae bacterium]|jgi:phenylacetate-coenzyme A ligase PaaK-like adenylate-forming protein|nr:acyl-protein synthetase [Oscillospiraceae bacterium]
MGAGERLFFHRGLYDLERTESLFLDAMRDNVRRHAARCPEYAAILESRGFSADSMRTMGDLQKLPPLPTLFLKRRTLYSAPENRLMFKSTTSGTSGRVSAMGLDKTSALRGAGMILGTFFTHRLLSPRPTNYIVLSYQPAKRNKIGAVKTAYASTFAAFPLRREYALRDNGTEYELNIEGLKSALQKYEKQGRPVRIIGFPAYLLFLLNELRASGIRLRLHPKSLLLLSGGWKQFFTERLDKPELYARVKDILGLGDDRIREFFGAVEHPIAYFDCPNHHFHVPIYSRVIIRDVNTLEPVGYGAPGLLNLLTPMMTSMPFSSVMTDDLAVLRPGGACGCGIDAPYFEVLGRVGMADIKTCAAGAAELLADLQKGAGA